MSTAAQKRGVASDPNAKPKAEMIAELKAEMIAQLKALKDPKQQKNASRLEKLINEGHLPNSKNPVLYAIDGKACLGTVAEYDRERKQNPEAKHLCLNWNGVMTAGVKPPLAAATRTQAQLAASACFGRAPALHYAHEILVQFRCPELDGGDPKFTIIAPTINDTGSNVQSVHLSDWNALKTPAVELFKAQMLTAAGVRNVWNMFLEIRIVKPEYKKNAQNVEEVTGNFEPLTPWYLEMLRLVEDNEDLLSGETMRKYLYFATAPGNEKLYVSQKKNGIFKDLPVV